jgi:hypothetical protein
MKKLLTIVSVLALSTAFLGCKKKEEAKPAEPAPAVDPAPAPAPAEKPAEPAPAPEPTAAAGSTGIPECDAYVATMDKYAKCDKIPADAKKAMVDAFEQGKQGWAALANAPAETKTAAAGGCKTADDAAKQALTQLGCN